MQGFFLSSLFPTLLWSTACAESARLACTRSAYGGKARTSPYFVCVCRKRRKESRVFFFSYLYVWREKAEKAGVWIFNKARIFRIEKPINTPGAFLFFFVFFTVFLFLSLQCIHERWADSSRCGSMPPFEAIAPHHYSLINLMTFSFFYLLF